MKKRKYINDPIMFKNYCLDKNIDVCWDDDGKVKFSYYNNHYLNAGFTCLERIKSGDFYFIEIEEEYNMQEINLEPKKELTIDDVKYNNHIGVIIGDKKYYIANVLCQFILLGRDEWYFGCNDCIGILEKNIKECLKRKQIKKAYKFETRKELFKWLSE